MNWLLKKRSKEDTSRWVCVCVGLWVCASVWVSRMLAYVQTCVHSYAFDCKIRILSPIQLQWRVRGESKAAAGYMSEDRFT